MRRSDQDLSETDIRPADGKTIVVRADAEDSRKWLANSPVCPELNRHRIRHLAVARMPAPFQIVRTRLEGSYFLACFGGEGRVLVDGRWTNCRPGQGVLLPPRTLQAFHTVPGKVWEICWVRYQEREGERPLTTAQTPVIAHFDPEGIRLAILGLYHECTAAMRGGTADSQTARFPSHAVGHWIELINLYVMQFAAPTTRDLRIGPLWESVAESLHEEWTVSRMAEFVHLSEKQLQRLCLKELGRSPRQQLIWLRMKKAAELLMDSRLKIETIAGHVGYQNPFVFSATFKRVMGWSPSAYPGRDTST